AFLRARELRPVHALPCRHGQGRAADARGEMGPRHARGPEPGDDRCLDLRPGSGGAESRALRAEVLSGRGLTMSAAQDLVMTPATVEFELDGVKVKAQPGETILQAAE